MNKYLIPFVFIVSFFLFTVSSEARYDPAWNWKVHKTDGFLIYYPEGYEAFAQRIASLAPEVKKDVNGYFGIKPRRLPIVLNPGTDIFNGFYTPFPNRISLFETPCYTLKGFGSSTSDIADLVFTHEYTHYNHITERIGWNRRFADVFGESAGILNLASPLWMIEGITTNTETMFTDGGRGRSPSFKGNTYSFTDNGKFWSLSAAGAPGIFAPPGGRFYMSGFFIVNYLNRTYGSDSFARVAEYQARHPWRTSVSALKHVTKKSSSKFYREFLTDFNAKADSVRKSQESQGLGDGKPVLSEKIDTFNTYFWTNDNHLLALRSGYNKKNAFIEYNPISDISKVTNAGSVLNIGKISPLKNGSVLLGEPFIRPLSGLDLDVIDLVAMDIRTHKRKRLTENAHVFTSGVSRDGSKIAMVVRNGMWMDLAVLNSDGSGLRKIVTAPGLYWEAPSWSPDGSFIAVIVKSGGNNGIAFVNPQNGEIKIPFNMSGAGFNEPSFSPDGKWLVFSSSLEGVWDIYTWNIAEKKLYRLTSVPWEASDPQVSPDGSTIAFLSTVRGVKQVRLMPFIPESGKEVLIETGGELDYPGVAEKSTINVKPSKIPLSVWNPYLRSPFIGTDEKGSQSGYSVMGGDPLGINIYSAKVFYGAESKRPGYDINLTNNTFWPSLNFRVYDSSIEGNTLGGGDSRWFRERGGEFSINLDSVVHRLVPSTVTGSYSAGVRLRKFDSLDSLRFNKNFDMSRALFAGFSVSRIPDSPARDLTPGWGQSLSAFYERGYGATGSELDTHNLFVRASQFVPSPFKHHGFEFSITHQNQSGLIHYNTTPSIPRGYDSDESPGGFNLNRTLTSTVEYYFPFGFPDRGLRMTLLHLNLVYGSLFIDHGAGWLNSFDKDVWAKNARTSLGASLRFNSYFIYSLPIDIGIQGGYKTIEGDWFVNMVLGNILSGSGFINKIGRPGDTVSKYNLFKSKLQRKFGGGI